MGKRIPEGTRQGRLTWIKPTDKRNKNGKILWLVICDCGKELYYNTSDHRENISCGCLKEELRKAELDAQKKQTETGQKYCHGCEKFHNISEFHKSPSTWDGLTTACKEIVSKRSKEWRLNNVDRAKHNDLMKKTGVTLEQKRAKILEQNGKCAGCGGTEPGGKYNDWHTDHDHVTGKFRGILCSNCNTALGMLKDNPQTLRQLASYLENQQEKII